MGEAMIGHRRLRGRGRRCTLGGGGALGGALLLCPSQVRELLFEESAAQGGGGGGGEPLLHRLLSLLTFCLVGAPAHEEAFRHQRVCSDFPGAARGTVCQHSSTACGIHLVWVSAERRICSVLAF